MKVQQRNFIIELLTFNSTDVSEGITEESQNTTWTLLLYQSALSPAIWFWFAILLSLLSKQLDVILVKENSIANLWV